MTVLFAGGRLDSVLVVGGTVTENSTATNFDSAYADAALSITTASSIFEATQRDSSGVAVDLASGETGFYHFEARIASNYSNSNPAYLVDSSGNPWLAMRGVGSGNYGLFYNSGTGASPTWTQIGSSFAVSSAVTPIDIKLTLGSPHSAEWYVGGSSVASGTFTQASLTSIRGLRFAGNGIGANLFSQILIANGRSTVGAKVKTLRASGAGGNTGWTGAFTNVNEAVNNDATLDSTTAAGNRQTYAMGNLTVPTNYAILSVFQFLRAKNDGAAPANIKSVVRQGTTNYDYATNMSGIGTGFAALAARYDTDPSTGVGWTETGINSAEFGYLSVT